MPLTPAGIGTEQALAVHRLHGRAPTAFLVSFGVGMKLILSIWSILLGATAILLMARTLRWRRMLAHHPPPTTQHPDHLNGAEPLHPVAQPLRVPSCGSVTAR